MSSIRLEKISGLIKEEVSSIIKKEVSDPRIGFISITDVEVSPDIRQVKIFVSCLGSDQEKAATFQGLKSATPFIKGKIGHHLSLRFTPEIVFIADNSLERGSRVLAIMHKLEKEEPHVKTKKPKKRAKK